jgi:hypothetical protein
VLTIPSGDKRKKEEKINIFFHLCFHRCGVDERSACCEARRNYSFWKGRCTNTTCFCHREMIATEPVVLTSGDRLAAAAVAAAAPLRSSA